MKRRAYLAIATAAVTFCALPRLAPALSSRGAVSLPSIVVSGSHMPGSIENLAASTTVITRGEIEARQPASVVDLLRQTRGLHVDQPGGRGAISSTYLRGADPNFTLVLIDGVQVNDPTNSRGGSFDLSSLAVSDVERVEIVRGSLSSVYGSDAIAGVINIVTRRPTDEPSYTAETGVGNEGYRHANAAARGPLFKGGKLGYALSANYVDDGEPVAGSEFIGRQFVANLSAQPADRLSVLLTSRYANNHGESFPDDSGGPLFAQLRDVDRRDAEELSIGLNFDHELTSAWRYRVDASWYRREEDFISPGVAPGVRDEFGVPPNSSDSDFQRGEILASNLVSLSDSLRLSAGVDARFEDGASDSALGGTPLPRFDLDQSLYGYFAELRYTSTRGMNLQAGLRLDDPEDFGSKVSPSIGVLYPFNAGDTLFRANWGKGFKLPSFFALGNPIVGNPDLQPETSESFDLGVEQGLWSDRATVSITGFYNRYFDLIDFEEATFRLVNRDEVTTQGIELGFGLESSDVLWLDSHVTFTETDIEGTSEELRNRPEWRGGVVANWQPRADLVLSLSALHVGKVLDSSVPTGDVTLDDYQTLDISGTWRLQPGVRLALAIDNLLDEDYQEFVGFPAPGTRFRVSAGLDF